MKQFLCLLFLLNTQLLFSQSYYETEDSIAVKGQKLYGSLTIPNQTKGKTPLVIFVAGSGPTDRNGNSFMGLKTDAYKKLAYALAKKNISCFRYDKRGVAKSLRFDLKEGDLRFEDYVKDAQAVIAKYKSDHRFSKIIIVGHSEGSLVAMLSAEKGMKYISIAGISTTANNTLKIQLQGRLGDYEEGCFAKLDSLRNGHMVTCDIPGMESILRPGILPYLISWFQYDPSEQIKKLTVPPLIINGTMDSQVAEMNANGLHQAYPGSILKIIPKMNHTLVEVNNETENTKSYTDPEMPISEILVEAMTAYIL